MFWQKWFDLTPQFVAYQFPGHLLHPPLVFYCIFLYLSGFVRCSKVTVKEPTVDTLDVPATSLAYYAGATFDPEALGMITATYTNGKTENVLPTDCTFSIDGQGITLPYRFETVGDYTLTVTYKGGTDTVDITVNFGTVTSITVSGPTKTEYEVGQTFSSAGLMVTAHDDYGNSEPVNNNYTFTITDEYNKEVYSPYKFDTAGTYTLTVSYNNMEATVEITVNPATVTGIEVTSKPTKMTYISGESFDPAGMTITATYSDGTKTAVNDYTCSPETVTKDNTKVTITYGELETTVTVQILNGNNSYDANTKTYSIATADGLLAWNEAVQSDLSLNCILTENIDLKDKTWTPIGNSFQTYNGTFDGQGYSITGLNASSLFGGIGESATVKNLQLVDVKLNESGGATAGIVVNNYGTIMACSMTGEISAYSYTSGIANSNLGKIVACWFSGTLKENEGYGIVAFNYGTITACFWDGNTTNGYRSNEGETVEATKVEGSTVTWQDAVDGMNEALTDNDYKWVLTAGNPLPTLKK